MEMPISFGSTAPSRSRKDAITKSTASASTSSTIVTSARPTQRGRAASASSCSPVRRTASPNSFYRRGVVIDSSSSGAGVCRNRAQESARPLTKPRHSSSPSQSRVSFLSSRSSHQQGAAGVRKHRSTSKSVEKMDGKSKGCVVFGYNSLAGACASTTLSSEGNSNYSGFFGMGDITASTMAPPAASTSFLTTATTSSPEEPSSIAMLTSEEFSPLKEIIDTFNKELENCSQPTTTLTAADQEEEAHVEAELPSFSSLYQSGSSGVGKTKTSNTTDVNVRHRDQEQLERDLLRDRKTLELECQKHITNALSRERKRLAEREAEWSKQIQELLKENAQLFSDLETCKGSNRRLEDDLKRTKLELQELLTSSCSAQAPGQVGSQHQSEVASPNTASQVAQSNNILALPRLTERLRREQQEARKELDMCREKLDAALADLRTAYHQSAKERNVFEHERLLFADKIRESEEAVASLKAQVENSGKLAGELQLTAAKHERDAVTATERAKEMEKKLEEMTRNLQMEESSRLALEKAATQLKLSALRETDFLCSELKRVHGDNVELKNVLCEQARILDWTRVRNVVWMKHHQRHWERMSHTRTRNAFACWRSLASAESSFRKRGARFVANQRSKAFKTAQKSAFSAWHSTVSQRKTRNAAVDLMSPRTMMGSAGTVFSPRTTTRLRSGLSRSKAAEPWFSQWKRVRDESRLGRKCGHLEATLEKTRVHADRRCAKALLQTSVRGWHQRTRSARATSRVLERRVRQEETTVTSAFSQLAFCAWDKLAAKGQKADLEEQRCKLESKVHALHATGLLRGYAFIEKRGETTMMAQAFTGWWDAVSDSKLTYLRHRVVSEKFHGGLRDTKQAVLLLWHGVSRSRVMRREVCDKMCRSLEFDGTPLMQVALAHWRIATTAVQRTKAEDTREQLTKRFLGRATLHSALEAWTKAHQSDRKLTAIEVQKDAARAGLHSAFARTEGAFLRRSVLAAWRNSVEGSVEAGKVRLAVERTLRRITRTAGVALGTPSIFQSVFEQSPTSSGKPALLPLPASATAERKDNINTSTVLNVLAGAEVDPRNVMVGPAVPPCAESLPELPRQTSGSAVGDICLQYEDRIDDIVYATCEARLYKDRVRVVYQAWCSATRSTRRGYHQKCQIFGGWRLDTLRSRLQKADEASGALVQKYLHSMSVMLRSASDRQHVQDVVHEWRKLAKTELTSSRIKKMRDHQASLLEKTQHFSQSSFLLAGTSPGVWRQTIFTSWSALVHETRRAASLRQRMSRLTTLQADIADRERLSAQLYLRRAAWGAWRATVAQLRAQRDAAQKLLSVSAQAASAKQTRASRDLMQDVVSSWRFAVRDAQIKQLRHTRDRLWPRALRSFDLLQAQQAEALLRDVFDLWVTESCEKRKQERRELLTQRAHDSAIARLRMAFGGCKSVFLLWADAVAISKREKLEAQLQEVRNSAATQKLQIAFGHLLVTSGGTTGNKAVLQSVLRAWAEALQQKQVEALESRMAAERSDRAFAKLKQLFATCQSSFAACVLQEWRSYAAEVRTERAAESLRAELTDARTASALAKLRAAFGPFLAQREPHCMVGATIAAWREVAVEQMRLAKLQRCQLQRDLAEKRFFTSAERALVAKGLTAHQRDIFDVWATHLRQQKKERLSEIEARRACRESKFKAFAAWAHLALRSGRLEKQTQRLLGKLLDEKAKSLRATSWQSLFSEWARVTTESRQSCLRERLQEEKANATCDRLRLLFGYDEKSLLRTTIAGWFRVAVLDAREERLASAADAQKMRLDSWMAEVRGKMMDAQDRAVLQRLLGAWRTGAVEQRYTRQQKSSEGELARLAASEEAVRAHSSALVARWTICIRKFFEKRSAGGPFGNIRDHGRSSSSTTLDLPNLTRNLQPVKVNETTVFAHWHQQAQQQIRESRLHHLHTVIATRNAEGLEHAALRDAWFRWSVSVLHGKFNREKVGKLRCLEACQAADSRELRAHRLGQLFFTWKLVVLTWHRACERLRSASQRRENVQLNTRSFFAAWHRVVMNARMDCQTRRIRRHGSSILQIGAAFTCAHRGAALHHVFHAWSNGHYRLKVQMTVAENRFLRLRKQKVLACTFHGWKFSVLGRAVLEERTRASLDKASTATVLCNLAGASRNRALAELALRSLGLYTASQKRQRLCQQVILRSAESAENQTGMHTLLAAFQAWKQLQRFARMHSCAGHALEALNTKFYKRRVITAWAVKVASGKATAENHEKANASAALMLRKKLLHTSLLRWSAVIALRTERRRRHGLLHRLNSVYLTPEREIRCKVDVVRAWARTARVRASMRSKLRHMRRERARSLFGVWRAVTRSSHVADCLHEATKNCRSQLANVSTSTPAVHSILLLREDTPDVANTSSRYEMISRNSRRATSQRNTTIDHEHEVRVDVKLSPRVSTSSSSSSFKLAKKYGEQSWDVDSDNDMSVSLRF
ncbi:unnamed protein product [Amoebophrya sp. A25]|nr:unnamed protein product [Amoebophrya sp. A25]|eukprot:GSA25T00000261001.1